MKINKTGLQTWDDYCLYSANKLPWLKDLITLSWLFQNKFLIEQKKSS